MSFTYRSMFWWHLFRELIVFQSFQHLCLSDEWKLSSLEGMSQSIYVDAVINLQDSNGKFITPIVLIEASGHAKKSITDQHKDYNKLPTIMSLVLLNQLKKMKNLPDEIRSRLCVFGIYISALQIQIFKMTVSGDDLEKPTFLLHLSRKWFFSVSDDDSCIGHSEALDLFYSNEKYHVSVTDQLDVPNADTALSPIPSDDEGDDVNSKEEEDESDLDIEVGVKKTAHKDLLQMTDLEELASKLSVLESFGR